MVLMRMTIHIITNGLESVDRLREKKLNEIFGINKNPLCRRMEQNYPWEIGYDNLRYFISNQNTMNYRA